MPNPIFGVVGSALYVSATLPATETEAGYGALTWTHVGMLEGVPPVMMEQNIVTFTPVASGIPLKVLGAVVLSEEDITIALTGDDAGEVILRNKAYGAVNADKRVAVKEVLANGDTYFWTAVCNKFNSTGGTAEVAALAAVGLSATTRPIKAA